MPVLRLDGVTMTHARGRNSVALLDGVSLVVPPGEAVGVWGRRRSGRTTLLRIAAGIERPTGGRVWLDREELSEFGQSSLDPRLGFCHTRFDAAFGARVVDQVAVPLLAQGIAHPAALALAKKALRRTGAEESGGWRPEELDGAQAVRVGIARATVCGPEILLIDEPTVGVEPIDRDPLLRLLRDIVDEGASMLFTTGETAALAIADQACMLGGGLLRTYPATPPASARRGVLELQPRDRRGSA